MGFEKEKLAKKQTRKSIHLKCLLTFPTKCVTNPVCEVQEILFVRKHKITGQERFVVFYEDLRDDLLFGFLLVGIA